MLRAHALRFVASLAVLLLTVVLVQPAFPHETSTSEILRKLQDLRQELHDFLIPADISGRWQVSDTNCSGYMPAWIQQVLDDNSAVTWRIRQYGNHLVTESSTKNGTQYGSGIIRGDYANFETQLAVANDFDVVVIYSIGNVAASSRSLLSYTAHLQIVVNEDSYAQNCTGTWQRTGD